jgi:hypothetical protein
MTAAARAATAAAAVTQRSWRRSIPRARRNRSTIDPAATSSATRTMTSPSLATAASGPLWNSSGMATASYGGSSGFAWRVTDTTDAVTTSPTHQRQRGDGGDPVGVRSRTNPSRVDSTPQLTST